MNDVEIRFEPDGLSGLVAVGTYLIEAAGRLGVEIEDSCGRKGECEDCRVTVVSGKELLSEPTTAEISVLSLERISKGERLSCQAKIIASGEIVVMKPEKEIPESERKEDNFEKFRKEFYDMPLEKKIASLVELEAITLGETLAFVINSPFKVFDMLIDVMAELGLKLEKEERAQKRPPEHREEQSEKTAGTAEQKPENEQKAEAEQKVEDEKSKD